MADFTPINTQEELNSIIGERLRRERDTITRDFESKISEKDGQISKFQADMEALNKQLQEANQKISGIPDLEQKIKAYERASVKSKVARELGIPDVLADRLSGESEEDLRKDAEGIKKLIDSFRPTAPLANIEQVQQSKKDEQLIALLKDMKGE